jgi:hypothetical protein
MVAAIIPSELTAQLNTENFLFIPSTADGL